MSDQILSEVVSNPVSTIEDVVVVMQQIDDLLSNNDGLKWFNFLYLKVTEAVLQNPPANGWLAPQWLARLDVVFAELYFGAIRSWIDAPDSAPKAWRVMLNARHRPNIMRVQFALCGMNAHINRDLQIALVQTCQEQNVKPKRNTPHHQDFQSVNNILETVEAQVKLILATGIVGEIDENLGNLDDILAFWGVTAARDTAWANAEILWSVRNNSFLRKIKIGATDNITSALGRALIIPVSL
jgi:Family of unknown function (DUF5995)